MSSHLLISEIGGNAQHGNHTPLQVINRVHKLRYRVFLFSLYSMGLRLGEGLRIEVGDIDGARGRLHVRNAKGGKDRYVPIPEATLQILRRW